MFSSFLINLKTFSWNNYIEIIIMWWPNFFFLFQHYMKLWKYDFLRAIKNYVFALGSEIFYLQHGVTYTLISGHIQRLTCLWYIKNYFLIYFSSLKISFKMKFNCIIFLKKSLTVINLKYDMKGNFFTSKIIQYFIEKTKRWEVIFYNRFMPHIKYMKQIYNWHNVFDWH